jgi:hypothetical protein
MQKLNTVGFIPPPDFPAQGYNNIHECLKKYKDTHEVQWMSFSSGWNGVAYRYRAMAEYDEQFTTSLREFGNSPPPEERYQQGKALFGFFTNAVSVIECFFFSTYCMASILKPSVFPVSRPEDLRFYPNNVEPKFAVNFPNNPLSLSMSHCLSEPAYDDMCVMRNVLSHRGMPPRKFYKGGDRNGMATMPINPEAPSDQWQFDFSVDEQTTKIFREWLSNTLAGLMDSADKFCASQL